MICAELTRTIGIKCQPAALDGSVFTLIHPFVLPDGAPLPIYVEKLGQKIRFFDDGEVLFYLMGRGLRLHDQRNLKFVRALAEPSGAELTADGELELWGSDSDAAESFARYVEALHALVRWVREQDGIATESCVFLDEVALCLRAWKPAAQILAGPELTGVSGYRYRVDFRMNDQLVLAIAPHSAKVSSTIKKILDIRSSTENHDARFMVVVDDRLQSDAAQREGKILDAVANVLMMTRLEHNSRSSAQQH